MYEKIKSTYKAIKNKATEVALVGALTGMALLPGCRGKTPQNPDAEAEHTSVLVKQIEELGQKFSISDWYHFNLNNLVDAGIQGESGFRFPTSSTTCLLTTGRDEQVTAFYSPEARRYRSENGETQKIIEPAVAVSFHGKDITVHLIDTAPIDGRSIDAGVILQRNGGLQKVVRITSIAERQRLYDALGRRLIAYAQTQRIRDAERKTEADQEAQEREESAINEAWSAIKGE
ncbi:hypothetical protein KY338_05725 [Candidatus Woesearchaeota archaeon]|nr:hypothetical protein [Candidatus Woesearchaeota archaeon]MBW3006445.1 hypothetical protein [Candidatus Woesearchaeota archaeon]